MSSLYNEVLVDVKKIRENAIQDARNSIMEEIIPLVNKMISEEITNPSGAFEDTTEDPEMALPTVDTQTSTPVLPTDPTAVVPPPAVDPSTEALPPVDMGMGDLPSFTPDANGKITISLKDLMDCLQSKFAQPAPVETPAVTEPAMDPAVDQIPDATTPPASTAADPATQPAIPVTPPPATQPFAESKLAQLKSSLENKIEAMESVVAENLTPKDAKIIKDGVFVLFSKLQENTSFSAKEKRVFEKRLEKLYDKVDVLLESTIYGKTNAKVKSMKSTNKTPTSFEDLFEDASDALSEDMNLDEDAELAEIFGEAVDSVDECGDMAVEPEGDLDTVELELVDDDADPMAMGESRELDDNMIVEISEDELREALASLTEEFGQDEDSEEEDDSKDAPGLDADGDETDETLDIEMDEGSSATDDIFGDAVNASVSKTPAPQDTKQPKTPTMEAKSTAQNMQLNKKLQEADRKLRAAHAQLVETNLLNAKLVYTTQFMKRGGLTQVQMDKIVECLDACSTVEQAKDTATKLVKKLNERKASMNETVKRQTMKPSTKPAVIKEQVGVEENNVLIEGVVDDSRWAQLAGINRPGRR